MQKSRWMKWTGGFQSVAGAIALGVIALSSVNPAAAQDPSGMRWRQLYETTGFSWDAVAEVCATDGVTPCWGSIGAVDLTGWTWATREQVVEFLGIYAPAILDAEPPQVFGDEYFFVGSNFTSAVMRWTDYFGGYGFYSEWTDGWTSSLDENDLAVYGRVGWGWWPPGGSFGAYDGADPAIGRWDRGVWLWQPSGASWQR